MTSRTRSRRAIPEDARTQAFRSVQAHLGRTQGDVDTVVADDVDVDVDVEITEREPRRSLPPRPVSKPRVRGEVIGRYVLLSELGKGGMGVVWAAHDPELDRQVALKLLTRGAGSARLLREAQALARLAHPNVVAVHDAGEVDGEVWLAMELVDGMTFKTWLERQVRPPAWTAVLDLLGPAGEGVAAAHQAGLVHRDLKPDNIMIGADGRPRVMDFGLARAGEGGPVADAVVEAPIPADPLISRSSLLASDVTRAGVLVGTPAYMAPEQFVGRADERADVFAFSVLLWEALYGLRPFGGDTPAAMLVAINVGRVQVPPRGRRVPRWLRRALLRGLAADPAARWTSMAAFLAALRRGRARVRALWIAAALGLVVAVIASALVAAAVQRSRAIAACEALGAEIEALWPGRAAAASEGLAGSGIAAPAETAAKIEPWLDRWGASWAKARTEVCVAAEVEETMDADLAQQATTCLDLQRVGVTSLVERLAAGDRTAAATAIGFAATLKGGDRCLDRRVLAQTLWPPPERRAEVDALQARLTAVNTMRALGDHDQALAEAEAILADAEAIGWGPAAAEAHFFIGSLHARKSRFDEAEAALRRAYFRAGREGADRLAASAATELVLVVGHELARPKEGREWAEHAAMRLGRVGEEDGLGGTGLLENLSVLERDTGAPDRALEIAERALAIETEALGEEHIILANTLNNLALSLGDLGRHQEARAHLQRALALREAVLGPSHPIVASSLHNLALAHNRLGNTAAALPLYERALAIADANGEGEGPRTAGILNSMIPIYLAQGRSDEAIVAGERALKIREEALGPEHPAVAAALNNLAIAILEQGDLKRALELHQRALTIREATLGPKSPDVARSLTNIGEIYEKRGDLRLARPALERALTIRSEATVAPQDLAYTQFALGRVLHRSGDHERGEALVKAAAEAWHAAEDKRAADADGWLTEHASAATPGSKKTRKKKKKAKKKRKK